MVGARPTRKLEPIEELVAAADRPRAAYARLLTVFAGFGLLLAMIGVGGVTAFWTARQTREIGIRIALGAQRKDILAWVFRHGMVSAGIGIGLGTLGAISLPRIIRHWLVGVSPQDPVLLVATGVLMAAVTTCACWLPARRAAKVDPMVALRYE